jgi:hypothetical protein
MLKNIVLLGASGLLGLIVSLIFKKKEYTSFQVWWDAEGIVIWMIASAVIAVFLLNRCS